MGWLVKFRSWSSIRKQIRKEYKASIANWKARTYQQSNYLLRDKLGSTRALLKCGNLVPRSFWPKLRHYEWRFDEPIVRITGYMVKNFGFNGWQWVLNGPFSSGQRDVKRSVQWKTKTSRRATGPQPHDKRSALKAETNPTAVVPQHVLHFLPMNKTSSKSYSVVKFSLPWIDRYLLSSAQGSDSEKGFQPSKFS